MSNVESTRPALVPDQVKISRLNGLKLQSKRYDADILSQSQRSLGSSFDPSIYSTCCSYASIELLGETISPNVYRNTHTSGNLKVAGGSSTQLQRSNSFIFREILSSSSSRLRQQQDLEYFASSFRLRSRGTQGDVRCFIAAGERIFSAHQDKKIRVWEYSQLYCDESPHHVQKLVATLPTLTNYLTTFIFPKNHVKDDRHNRRTCKLWIQHTDAISALALGPGGLLYSGSWDKTVKVWKMSNYKCLESFKAHDDAVNALVASKSGPYIYTGSADSKVKVWEREFRKHVLISTLEGHVSAVNALNLSPDESLLYSASSDKTIAVWEREESARHMSFLGMLKGHTHAVLSLATAAPNLLCSGSADKTIRVWRRDLQSPNQGSLHVCIAMLEGHKSPVKALLMRYDQEIENGCFVYSRSLDNELKEWWVSTTDHEEASDQTKGGRLLSCVNRDCPMQLISSSGESSRREFLKAKGLDHRS